MIRQLSSDKVRKTNRTGLILIAIAAILALVLMTLPVASFTTAVYTKKSTNTFVGDEKYVAAKAEADAALAEQQAANPSLSLNLEESVTERTNSKGKTTSMVTFSIASTITRNVWDFVGSSLPFGHILMLVVIALLAAVIVGVVGVTGGTFSTDPRFLTKGRKSIRGIACWLALISLLLIPVFAMNMTAVLQRQILVPLGNNAAVPEALLNGMSKLLYNGASDVSGMLSSITYQTTWALWVLMPVIGVMLCGLILLCKGALAQTLARGGIYLAAIVLCIVVLYPYYVMLITGFRSNAETTDMTFSHMLPTTWVWSNLSAIADRGVFGYLGNSLLLSVGATVIALVCGIPAAYAMSRMKFHGKKVFMGFVIMSQMFSPVVLLVGISRLMNTIGLNDSVTGLMLINAAFNQAFAIWLLRGTFMSISPEMEQAACIDGCSTFGSLVRVLLPMAAPGIVTTLIFVFINAWNEYTVSTVLISTATKRPITVGITQFSSFNMIQWEYLFASALIATIPVIILFMCIEKHLVGGLTSGGVKG